MELFTLTPLRQVQGKLRAGSNPLPEGEGIAELRNSYPDSDSYIAIVLPETEHCRQ